MSGPSTNKQEPARYELRISGHLDDHWSAWFGGSTLTRESDGTTTLRGPVVDQAALHGLLDRIRDLGVELISVQAVSDPRYWQSPAQKSNVRVDGRTIRCHVQGSFQPLLDAVRGYEVTGRTSIPALVDIEADLSGDEK
jgi:hypothetical protein